jgi:hypothetical protein
VLPAKGVRNYYGATTATFVLKIIASLVAAASTALIPMPAAHADATDYLICLGEKGISFGDGPDTEVAVGHKVWTNVQSGTPPLTAVFELEREGASEHDALGILQCALTYKP